MEILLILLIGLGIMGYLTYDSYINLQRRAQKIRVRKLTLEELAKINEERMKRRERGDL